jgi:hypothetical protein
MGVRWPNIMNTALFVNERFAARHEAIVIEYIKACLRTHRTLGSSVKSLVEAAHALLPDRDGNFESMAAAYVDARSWSPDGGASPAAIRETAAFLRRTGNLTEAVETSRLMNRRFLDRALEELKDGAP